MFYRHLILPAILGVFLVMLCACSKAQNNKEAVERGLMEYLKNRAGIDVTNMDVNIASVSFRNNEAEANVSFQAKGAKDHGGSMQLRYVLEQKDGKWVVKGKSGLSDHSAPAGAAPAEAVPALPPGHPPTGSGAKQ